MHTALGPNQRFLSILFEHMALLIKIPVAGAIERVIIAVNGVMFSFAVSRCCAASGGNEMDVNNRILRGFFCWFLSGTRRWGTMIGLSTLFEADTLRMSSQNVRRFQSSVKWDLFWTRKIWKRGWGRAGEGPEFAWFRLGRISRPLRLLCPNQSPPDELTLSLNREMRYNFLVQWTAQASPPLCDPNFL